MKWEMMITTLSGETHRGAIKGDEAAAKEFGGRVFYPSGDGAGFWTTDSDEAFTFVPKERIDKVEIWRESRRIDE